MRQTGAGRGWSGRERSTPTTRGSLKNRSSASSGVTRRRSQFFWILPSSQSNPIQLARGSRSPTSLSIRQTYTPDRGAGSAGRKTGVNNSCGDKSSRCIGHFLRSSSSGGHVVGLNPASLWAIRCSETSELRCVRSEQVLIIGGEIRGPYNHGILDVASVNRFPKATPSANLQPGEVVYLVPAQNMNRFQFRT